MKMMRDESNQSAPEWMMTLKEIMNESENFLWIIYYVFEMKICPLLFRYLLTYFILHESFHIFFSLYSTTKTTAKNVKETAN